MKHYSCQLATGLVCLASAAAFPFTAGRTYSSHSAPTSDPQDIEPLPTKYRLFEYDAAGALLMGPRFQVLDVGIGDDPLVSRGIAFGPDNLLYLVYYSFFSSTYRVAALDSNGTEQASYFQVNSNIGGTASFGKIHFESDGRFYVCAGDGLTRFVTGQETTRTRIWDQEAVFGVTRLPNGNLMIAEANELHEITEEGVFVRTVDFKDPNDVRILPEDPVFGSLRDVLYHPDEDAIYVTDRGQSGFHDKIFKIEPDTGVLLDIGDYDSPDDLALLSDGRILVGSNEEPPALFGADLEVQIQYEHNDNQPRAFVTPFPAVFNTLPPIEAEAPELTVAPLAGGGVTINWQSLADHSYVVQGSNNLADWTDLTLSIPGTGEELFFPAGPIYGTRLFRIVATRN